MFFIVFELGFKMFLRFVMVVFLVVFYNVLFCLFVCFSFVEFIVR